MSWLHGLSKNRMAINLSITFDQNLTKINFTIKLGFLIAILLRGIVRNYTKMACESFSMYVRLIINSVRFGMYNSLNSQNLRKFCAHWFAINWAKTEYILLKCEKLCTRSLLAEKPRQICAKFRATRQLCAIARDENIFNQNPDLSNDLLNKISVGILHMSNQSMVGGVTLGIWYISLPEFNW